MGNTEKLEIKALSHRVFYKWLIPALLEWVAIVSLFWVGFSAQHWLVWAIVIILLGSRQHAIGVLGHDGAHYTASKNKRLNDFTSALLCFWPVLTTLGDFRRFHYNHHQYFQTDQDPEIVFKTKLSAKQWQPPIARWKIGIYCLGDLIGFAVYEVFKARQVLTMSGPHLRNAPGRPTIGRWKSWVGPLLWLTTVAAILYEFDLLIAIPIWFAALGTSFWAFFRLRTWTEHGGTSNTHRIQLSWWQRLLITPHGSWSHYEHHNHPSIPFWCRHRICEEGARAKSLWDLLGSFGGTSSKVIAPSSARVEYVDVPSL